MSGKTAARAVVLPVVAGAVTFAGQGSPAAAAPITTAQLPAVAPAAAPAAASLPAAPVSAAPVTQAVAAKAFTLRYGSRGSLVKKVQRKVRVRADGVYGPITRAAVKRFQRRAGLKASGVVGATTWRKLGLGSVPSTKRKSSTSAAARSRYRYSLGPVRAHVRRAAYALGPRFGIKTVGGWRSWGADRRNGHPNGLALDFMTYRGTALANYTKANAGRYRVEYIIWNRRIWHRSYRAWRYYRGSSPHTDHVHVSFRR